jgi:non-ribosomal peptide synthetase component F
MTDGDADELLVALASHAESHETALIGGGTRLRFTAMWHRARDFAAQIAAVAAPGDVVGMLGEAHHCTVVALLAALQCGRPYVPLDPAYPVARLRHMVLDARVQLLLRRRGATVSIDWFDGRLLDMDDNAAAAATGREPRIDTSGESTAASISIAPDGTSLAYVLYTSGSTGRPKGVLGPRHALLSRLRATWSTYPYAAGEVCCHKTSLNFVDSVVEILAPLASGVPLLVVPAAARADPEQLVELLREFEVTRITLVPSLLSAMLHVHPGLGKHLPHLVWWGLSGEALSQELVRRFFHSSPSDAALLLNVYGSTEVAADCTWTTVERPAPSGGGGGGERSRSSSSGSLSRPRTSSSSDPNRLPAPSEAARILAESLLRLVPIGFTLPGCHVELLEPETLRRTDPEAIGEIFVSGTFLSDGYLGMDDATSFSFPRLAVE